MACWKQNGRTYDNQYASPVLQIRNVYPGWILVFFHPGFRIQQEQNGGGWEIFLLSYLFCRHKFHKTENYFVFEKIQKNLIQLTNNFNYYQACRNMSLGSGIRKKTHPGVKKAPEPGSAITACDKEEWQCLPEIIDKMQQQHRWKAKENYQNKAGSKKIHNITHSPPSDSRYSSYLSN